MSGSQRECGQTGLGLSHSVGPVAFPTLTLTNTPIVGSAGGHLST